MTFQSRREIKSLVITGNRNSLGVFSEKRYVKVNIEYRSLFKKISSSVIFKIKNWDISIFIFYRLKLPEFNVLVKTFSPLSGRTSLLS